MNLHGHRLSSQDEDAYASYVAGCAETGETPMSRYQWMIAGNAAQPLVEES